MGKIRRTVAGAAVAAMAMGMTACEPAQPFFASSTRISVSAGFQPFVGDFDGDGWDDIWWFDPTGQDRLWEGRADGRFAHTVAPTQVEGHHVAVVGDFGGDDADDVLWYVQSETPAPSTLVVSQVGGGVASSRPVDLPVGLEPSAIDDEASRDAVVLEAYQQPARVWDVDRGTDATTELPAEGAPGDFDGDGAGDVYLYGPGAAVDRVAWGDGAGGFQLQTVRNVTGDYFVVTFDGDGDGRDDLAFMTDPVGRPETMNLWFGAPGRTFRTESREPFSGRGPVEVHRSHTGGPDTLVQYWYSEVESWAIDAEGVTRVGPAARYDTPWFLTRLVGRFHDGLADDVIMYDEAGTYPDWSLATPAGVAVPG